MIRYPCLSRITRRKGHGFVIKDGYFEFHPEAEVGLRGQVLQAEEETCKDEFTDVRSSGFLPTSSTKP